MKGQMQMPNVFFHLHTKILFITAVPGHAQEEGIIGAPQKSIVTKIIYEAIGVNALQDARFHPNPKVFIMFSFISIWL